MLYIASITFACQLSALEFDVETIPVKPKHRVDILSFSNRASGDAKLLIIETPVISQLEKQMQGLSNEPVRHIKVFQRPGSQWNLVLTEALEDSMDLVDTISTSEGIQLVGCRDQNSSILMPTRRALRLCSRLRRCSLVGVGERIAGYGDVY